MCISSERIKSKKSFINIKQITIKNIKSSIKQETINENFTIEKNIKRAELINSYIIAINNLPLTNFNNKTSNLF